jgi:hypothetical protein
MEGRCDSKWTLGELIVSMSLGRDTDDATLTSAMVPASHWRQPRSRNVQKSAIVFFLVKEGCVALVRSAMMASRTAWRVAIPVLSLLLLGCSLLSLQHYTRGVEEVLPCHYMVPICACVRRADCRLLRQRRNGRYLFPCINLTKTDKVWILIAPQAELAARSAVTTQLRRIDTGPVKVTWRELPTIFHVPFAPSSAGKGTGSLCGTSILMFTS